MSFFNRLGYGRNIFFATLITEFVIWLLLFIFTKPISLGESYSIDLSTIWFFFSIGYNLFSFRWYKNANGENGYIEADQIGVRTIFGHPTDVIDSGLPFVPLGIFELEKLPIPVQQKEFPAEPQNIYRGDGDVPSNKFPPVRITFRDSIDEKDVKKLLGNEAKVRNSRGEEFAFIAEAPKDGLSRRVTAEVVPVVRWKIKSNDKEGGINFIRNIGSIDEANHQIEDELFSVLQRLLPNMSVGQAKQNFRWINTILMNSIISRTVDWGIEIEGAFLKMIPLHHTLNDAIALASEAEFKGRGEKEMIIKIGEGNARAAKEMEKQTQEGRAAGLKKLAAELGIEGEVAINQFVAGQLASGEGTIILGTDGLSQLAGVAAAIAKKSAS